MPYPPTIVQTGGTKILCASVPSVGGYLSKRFLWVLRILWEDAVAAWLVQWRPLHPLVECKKCIDFFVVTKFRCIFAM